MPSARTPIAFVPVPQTTAIASGWSVPARSRANRSLSTARLRDAHGSREAAERNSSISRGRSRPERYSPVCTTSASPATSRTSWSTWATAASSPV
ncbi:MAG: hypothetical protein QM804_03810 [Propionicimonas sp.]